MATGSITSLGLGSGLELQNILDQLKEVEQAPIKAKETKKTELTQQLNAYNSINAKLYSMKSHALSLSLESDFLKNKVSVSDEEILTARVDDGVSEAVSNVEVVQKAQANSWTSVGVASKSAAIYPEPSTTIGSTDTAVSQAGTMTIKYGSTEEQQDIQLTMDAGMSLDEIVEAINTSEDNSDGEGTQLVTATVEKNADDNYYIRLSATNGGNREDSQIIVSELYYVKADATVAIGKAADPNDATYITMAPGTTYEEAAEIINNSSDSHGAKAAIVDDGSDENPFKLVLTAKSTGEKNRIALKDIAILNLPLTEVTGKDGESLNAVLKIDGITYERQSNEGIDDVIAGVTLTINKTGEASVGIQNDTDQVKQHILDLVEGFNDLLAEIKGTSTTDEGTDTEETKDNPLKDTYAVKQMISDLHNLIGAQAASTGAYSSLFDLGMEINRDGSVTIDEDTLDQAIASDPEGVRSLFLGSEEDGIEGLGDIINDGITDMVSQNGSVTGQIDAAETQIERLDKDIETATERLNKRYLTMANEFTRLDTYISKLNNQASFLTSMIDSFNNANQD